MTKGGANAREAALASLIRCEKQGRYSNLELSASIGRQGFSGADKGLYTRLVYGVIERRITLDYIISRYSDIPLDRIDPDIAAILRIALYQLYYLDRIPESAAVNEAVDSAKRRKKSAAGFVNAVLRNAVRGGRTIPYPGEDDRSYLSVRYSIPDRMISMWKEQYGGEVCLGILEGIDRVPYTTVAVNTLKISREELSARLAESGCDISLSETAPRAIHIKNGFSGAAADFVKDGLCFVQDAASQNAVSALAPEPGELLIDVCACPGGKSFYAALCMENTGVIHSRDLHENKLPLIRSGAEKLGISIISASAANATDTDPSLVGRADRVICDVPCSGLGVIAKKPDLRYKTPEESARLPRVQSAILSASSAYLKKGGRLLYSTCTLNKNENESVAESFLGAHRDFKLIEQKTVFPDIDIDGFFYAIIERTR